MPAISRRSRLEVLIGAICCCLLIILGATRALAHTAASLCATGPAQVSTVVPVGIATASNSAGVGTLIRNSRRVRLYDDAHGGDPSTRVKGRRESSALLERIEVQRGDTVSARTTRLEFVATKTAGESGNVYRTGSGPMLR